jgi:hypothetical protein
LKKFDFRTEKKWYYISKISILNVLILLIIKETSNRKKVTQGNHQRNVTIAIHNTKMNKIKMILIISFNYIILRLPHMFYQLKPVLFLNFLQ